MQAVRCADSEDIVCGGLLIESKIGVDRRGAAPHPGPILKREYLDRLGIEPDVFAIHANIDRVALADIFAGVRSLDADSAVRFARALGLPAERLMQMQVRYDFAIARDVPELARLEPIGPSLPPTFPEAGFLRGRLGRTPDGFGDGSLFFQEDVPEQFGQNAYAGLHALWRGDRLRVFDAQDRPVWTGPLLQNLDGRILLPFARPAVWQGRGSRPVIERISRSVTNMRRSSNGCETPDEKKRLRASGASSLLGRASTRRSRC